MSVIFCSWKRKKISIRQLPQKTFKLLSFQKECHFYRFLLMILFKTKIIENKGFRAIHSIFHRHWAFCCNYTNVLYWQINNYPIRGSRFLRNGNNPFWCPKIYSFGDISCYTDKTAISPIGYYIIWTPYGDIPYPISKIWFYMGYDPLGTFFVT